MDGIGSVGTRPSFRDDEIDAMRKNEETSALANKARRDAGLKEADVGIRGDDHTLHQVLEEHQTHIGGGESVAGALHGIEVLEALGVGEHAMHALGRLPQVAIPLGIFVATQVGMYEMEKTKAETKDAATRDQLHAAILVHLDVPVGYKQDAIARLGVTMTKQSPASKISDQIGFDDKPYAVTLQLHCDQGMHAARTMIDCGGNKDAFLKANPKVAERYAADAAFHNGFDALCWAKEDSKASGNPASYTATIARLESRDARYDAAHITYRM